MLKFSKFARRLVENGVMDDAQVNEIGNKDLHDNLNTYIKGIVKFRNPKTGELIHEEENLVLMRTRVWLLEKLFNKPLPSSYSADVTSNRTIALFSVGSGGADINNAAFTPYTVKFSDKQLSKPVPFIIQNPDKANSELTLNNPSVLTALSETDRNKYYIKKSNPDGTVHYFGKRFSNATASNPLGDSRGWIINNEDGSVAFSLKMSIDSNECRGAIVNELGLWLAKYNSVTNDFEGLELATRLTFDSRSLKNLTDGLDIEYLIYI